MRAYYKVIENGFVTGFGTNGGDDVTGITETEYAELNEFFKTMPKAPTGKAYRMKAEPLEWALVDDPIEDEDIDEVELVNILFGEGFEL